MTAPCVFSSGPPPHCASRQAYARECKRRKAAHEKLIDLQGNIRVHARIRPATSGRASSLGMTDLIQVPCSAVALNVARIAVRAAWRHVYVSLKETRRLCFPLQLQSNSKAA